jgi:type VI secretion system protein VasG
VNDNQKLPFTYDDAVIKLIAGRCKELESGGRMIDAILTNTMLPKISVELLNRTLENRPPNRIHISVDAGEFAYDFE